MGKGTVRGNFGSIGNSPDQFKQYEILVEKKQLENARMVIRK